MKVLTAVFTVLGISVAFGQESIHPKTTPMTPMSVTTIRMPPPAVPPGWTLGTATPLIVPPSNNLLQAPIVISFGRGGLVDEHRKTFAGYQRRKAKVEIRGPCYSACTLVMAYVEPENVCIAPSAFMAFHAIRSSEHGDIMVGATQQFYADMPPLVRRWIDHSGGWQNLPLNSYWTLKAPDLWSMGYPKCN